MNTKQNSNISGTQKLAGALVGGKLLALLATFAIPIFLTRFLTKEDYGLYAQLFTVLTFLTFFFELGIAANLFYYYPTANRRKKRIYVFQTLLLLFISSGIAVLILVFPFLRSLLIGKGELNNYSLLIIVLVVFLIPTNIISTLYIVKNDKITAILFPLTEVVMRAGLVVVFVLVTPGVNSVFNAMLTSAILVFIFILFYTLKEIGFKKSFYTIDISLLSNQIKYSLPFGIASSLNTFARTFDKVLCISYLSTTSYATYAIAFYGVPGIQQIYNALAQVTVVRMTENIQKGNKIEALRIYKKMITHTYSFSVPAILIVSLYAQKIITFLFTDKFIDSTHLFQAYLVTFLIVMLGGDLILRASGETKTALKANFISALISVPSTIFLVKHFGLWGAMSGAIFSIVGPTLFMISKELKIMECDFSEIFPWREMFKILSFSLISLIPFCILEYFFSYGIFISGILAFIYLSIVVLYEIKYELFIIEKKLVVSFFDTIGKKFSH